MIVNSPPENLRSSSSVLQYQNIICCKSSSSCVADHLQSSSPIFFAAIDYGAGEEESKGFPSRNLSEFF
ncbi:hypothetical protein MRB53_030215 [Persea americana]|uniref:Uncharacterized protein n=1 Tax=Persea americana TaxID=3435 RepID=A0ACC2KKJ2_PERAE|nr:hypothetical protein MRB53_030215 [Persea americana]